MRTYKTEGIVIKRKNFGETDRILTIFTKAYGKIQVKAKGVRKINSKRSPQIELLNHALFLLYRGKNLPLLTEVDLIDNHARIKDNLTKIVFAYHFCELIDGLCPENQENQEIFELFKKTIKRLEAEEEISVLTHEFEINLLTLLGFYKPCHSPKNFATTSFIEQLLEKKLKTRQILNHFRFD